MNKRIAATAALLLATATTSDSYLDSQPDSNDSGLSAMPNQNQEGAVIVDSERSHLAEVLEEKGPKREYMFGKLKPEIPKAMIRKQDVRIQKQLTYVNTDAISCGNWKNKLCIELEEQGIPVAHLKPSFKGSGSIFSEHLESLDSYEAFETRITELLQPEEATNGLSYEQRLDNATEILARSALGVYQLLYRYYASYMKQSFSGEAGRKNMFRLISSKEKQDQMTEIVIRDLGKIYEWSVPVMAADYYGGPKLAVPLKEKLAGSTEHDQLLNGTRYHGYPSVMFYISSFEEDIARYATNEGLDANNLSRDDQVRFIRYAIAKVEANFDMQAFERNKQ